VREGNMGQSWDAIERAALELLQKQFAGIEEWPDATLRYMVAMATAVLKERGYDGGQGLETEGESN
jgi:hypothetical protein